jgi:prevent-host-death family protein
MAKAQVNIYEAKTRLSSLIDRAEAGHDVVIARSGRPVVRLTRISESAQPIRFGVLKGKLRIGRDFDAPLPAGVLAAFTGD